MELHLIQSVKCKGLGTGFSKRIVLETENILHLTLSKPLLDTERNLCLVARVSAASQEAWEDEASRLTLVKIILPPKRQFIK